MNLKELNQLNSRKDFAAFREKFQKQLLYALTLGGAVLVVLWQFVDKLYNVGMHRELYNLRGITLALYVANLIVAMVRANEKAYKQHLVVGFYFGTLYCTFLTIITGCFESPYWFSLFFILMAWFVVVPYTYKQLCFHGIAFTCLFIVLIAIYDLHISDLPNLIRFSFLYSGVIFIGIISAINRNKADAEAYTSGIRLQETNEELQSSNEELRAEMESHYETSRKLEERQQFIDSILLNAPIVIWSIDLDGRFTYTHGKGLENIGILPQQNIGKSVFDVYKGTDAESFVRRVLAGETLSDIVKVGNLIYDTRVSALVNLKGEKYGYMGVAMDITEQKRVENENLKFRLALDQVPGAVFIMDKQFNFEYINPHFTKISGYTEEDLLHKNINETLYHGAVPESRRHITDSIIKGESWQGELLTFNKNGSTYWANTIAAPFRNEAYEVDGYIVIQQDVTERKILENTILESETLYRTLIECSLDSVVLTQDFKFLYFNKVFLDIMGYTYDELMTIEPTSVLDAEDRERVMQYHAQRLSGEIKNQTYKARFVKKDGNKFIAELNSTSVVINGKPASLITMRDVTERESLYKAISESESKYKALVENSQDGITIIRDNKIIFANDTYCKMLGYSRDELYNMPSVSTLHPDEHAKALSIAKRRRELDFTTINEVFRMLTKDGQIKECETSSTLIQYNGEWASFFTSHDITESKRMQEVIMENEKKYRLLFEAESDAIFMIHVETGDILDTNPAASRIYGYSREEFLTMKNTDVSAEPEQTNIATQNHQTLVPLRFHKRKDGKIIPVELSAGFSILNDRNIQIVTSRDITQRVESQRALEKSEEKYRELVETTNSIILKWDKDFRITFLNEYGLQFFGFTREEIELKPLVGTIVPHSEEVTGRNLDLLMEDIFINPEKYAHNINENMRKNGERVWVSWNNTAIIDDSGTVTDMFSIGTDITERRKNEEELRITKEKLQLLNQNLEKEVNDTVKKLTEANTQLIRLQKENLQSQYEVLRQQVNPHFLFNSLNVLTSLIKLEPDLAEKFTEHLSKVYRYVLENKDNDLVSLQTELEFLDAYLFLLHIRFMDKIKVEINIELDRKAYLILPLALQLIIENAIKHNTMSKKAPLVIRIFADNQLMLNIINNLQERESHMASTGVGLKNIALRYELLELAAPEFYKTECCFVAKIPLKHLEE